MNDLLWLLFWIAVVAVFVFWVSRVRRRRHIASQDARTVRTAHDHSLKNDVPNRPWPG
jgi:cytochrome c-type biogenesis protein CcmH/NrfF